MKPLWIVQNNLGSTGNFETMRNYAYGSGIPFVGVKVRPFTDDTPEDNTDGPVVIYGACGMVRNARKTGLKRGVFDNEQGFLLSTWKNYYGENMLNYDSHIVTWKTARESVDFKGDWFIRSNDDEKTVAGSLIDFNEFKQTMLERIDITDDLELIISLPKTIYREYRCFVIDGKVISASRYAEKNYSISSFELKDAVKFATQMVERYQPHNIFVIDVCDTDEGPKIVELNGFNSAGFYNTDIPAIMDAVNNSVYFKG